MKNTILSVRNQHLVGIFCIMISAVGFGSTGVFSSIMNDSGLTVWDSLAIRYIGSLFVLLPFLLIKKTSFKIPVKLIPTIIINAIVAFGATGTLLFLSYQYTTIAIATTLHFTYPLIVILLCVVTGSEKINFKIVLLAIFSLVGLVFITEPWTNYTTNLLGPFLAVISAFTFALYVKFLNNTSIKQIDNGLIVFFMFLFAGLLSTIIAMEIRFIQPSKTPILLEQAIPASLYMILLSTVLPVLLFSIGNRKIGGTTSSLLSMLEPITAIVLGITMLGERISWTFAIGAPIILFSAFSISKITLKNRARFPALLQKNEIIVQ